MKVYKLILMVLLRAVLILGLLVIVLCFGRVLLHQMGVLP